MEHAMAALYGCGVDNCDIELDGEEFPILDGSSRFYVEAIERWVCRNKMLNASILK